MLLLATIGLVAYAVVRASYKAYIGQLLSERERVATQYAELQKYHAAEQRRYQYLQQHAASVSAPAPIPTDGLEPTIEDSLDAPTDNITPQNLAQEMENFRKRNLKLWAQSIAVHKEKERINQLRSELQLRHNDLTDSIRYAKRIQQALLPTPDEIDKLLHHYFILWRPRDIVSGDFYWIRRMGDSIYVVVADCTGHGVPGAFMSMLGISFLNELASHMQQQLLPPNELLEQMRQQVKDSLQQSPENYALADGMDMAICRIDLQSQKLHYAGANTPLAFVRQGTLELLKATHNPIGIYRKERPFELHTIDFLPGDMFFLFSDGIHDQFGGPTNAKFSTARLRQLLLETSALPHQQQLQHCSDTLERWQGDQRQLDDMLLMGVRL